MREVRIHKRLARPHDWSYLFSHYAADDLAVAGMPGEALQQFLGSELDIHAKWRLFEPVWPKALRLDGGVRDACALHMMMLEEVRRRAADFDGEHLRS